MNRTIIPLVVLIAATPIILSAQTTIPGGNVSGTWTAAGSPYLVQGSITIHADSTLNLQPGVEVNFQGNHTFTVNGLLQAVGTATDSIQFTASTTWWGITFADAPDSSHLAYCTIGGSNLAGIICSNSNPVITNSTISNNVGAIYGGIVLFNSNPRITHCTISNNRSNDEGGGIRMVNSSPEISYCSIVGNYGMSFGGGISCGAGCAPRISHTSITENLSGGFGGGIYVTRSHPVISNSTIGDNNATFGAGIAFLSGGRGTITNCFMTADTASSMGGGIYIASPGGTVTIDNSTFSNCTSNHEGGGIYISQADTVSVASATFDANRAGRMGGGAMYSVDCSTLVINHCDLVNNRAPVIEGGIWLRGNTNIVVKDCIFRDQMGFDLIFDIYSSASVSYSDFYGSSRGPFGYPPPGLGALVQTNPNGDSCDAFYNIYLNPLFADAANSDYRLGWANWPTPDATKSPCIDAGDPAGPLDPDSTFADIGRYSFDQRMPVIAISDSVLVFGMVTVGQQRDLPLTMRNIGRATLHVRNILNKHAAFTHNWTQADSLIPPGDSMVVTVKFEPGDTSLVSDTLSIQNNAKWCQVLLSGKGGAVVGMAEVSELPKVYALLPAYPNPFNPTTTIRYGLPQKSVVCLTVYDLLGQEVAMLVQGEQEAGYHEMRFDASALASGVYIYKLQAGDFVQSRKFLLLR